MPRRMCRRHGEDHPCTCAMGNLYRFVEPVVLRLLKKKGRSYGYDLSGDLQKHALTDAEIERAALYRTLRRLELNGNVASRCKPIKAAPRGESTNSHRGVSGTLRSGPPCSITCRNRWHASSKKREHLCPGPARLTPNPRRKRGTQDLRGA